MFKRYRLRDYDFKLVLLILALSAVGVIAVGSAEPSLQNKQLAGVVAGVVLMVVVSLFDYTMVIRLNWLMYVANLVLLVAKVACSTVLVVIIADRSRKMSLVYRISFLLTMAAVLLMPYGGHCPDVMYGIASFGAFLFKIMIMILAFNFCQRYRTSPLLVYALTRITFSLDLLLGFGGFNVYRMLAPAVPDLLGLISVALGLLVVAIYSFVFTDRSYAPSFVAADGPAPSGETVEERCDRLVRVGSLSRRESDVLRLVAKGRSAPRICEELHLAMNTVNTHTSHIYQKLKIHSRQELLDLLENMAPEEERPSVDGRS